jgi:hypothetical protein
MDPYLEKFWADVRASLLVYSSEFLNEALPDGYVSRMDERWVFNFAIRQPYIEIQDFKRDQVITHIEFFSPTSKMLGDGLDQYLQKRIDLKRNGTSLVEIDLMRCGHRSLVSPFPWPAEVKATYSVVVHRGWEQDKVSLYPIRLSDRLPTFAIPLREGEPEIAYDLQRFIEKAYRNSYADIIDYRQPPVPPLEGEDAKWADELLKSAGKR